MNHGKNHLYIMGIGYLAILILALATGANVFFLFFFLCFFMMAAVMLGMNHDGHDKGGHKHE